MKRRSEARAHLTEGTSPSGYRSRHKSHRRYIPNDAALTVAGRDPLSRARCVLDYKPCMDLLCPRHSPTDYAAYDARHAHIRPVRVVQ